MDMVIKKRGKSNFIIFNMDSLKLEVNFKLKFIKIRVVIPIKIDNSPLKINLKFLSIISSFIFIILIIVFKLFKY